MSQDPGAAEKPSGRGGASRALVLATFLLSAVFVFSFLPRISAPPVVTTDRATPRPTTPASSPSPSSPASETRAPATSVADPPRLRDHPPPTEPADDAWAVAVSEATAALDRGSLTEAREAFARAEAARPGTPSVRDGVWRLENAQRDASLAEHQGRALRAEAAEDWSGALAEYDAAQKLDPVVAFAVEGRARAAQRRALDEGLEAYLKRPDRLSAEAVAHEAEAALDRAGEVEPAGPRLARQRAALRAALAAARIGVSVRLVSDGLTDVTVLRVGHLGMFKERTLELRPGTYVVVGVRRGYRDARLILEVTPGRAPEPLRVRCEEAL